MALPNFFDGETLFLNIVVLPRNQNPLKPAIELDAIIPTAPPFAEAKLRFDAKIISGFSVFPHSLAATASRTLPVVAPAQQVDLCNALANQFQIKNLNQSNADLTSNTDTAQNNPAVAAGLSVQKYLPLTYRKAFNFTTPRTPNAHTGDGYRCAIQNAGHVPGFKRSPDTISWGKVFAYALRQPRLATALGLVYEAQLAVTATDFPAGGWLFVDLAEGSDYTAQQSADSSFIARYAARIPPLVLETRRSVFAPMLVPVLPKARTSDPDPEPDGNYDDVLLEIASYDDGFAKIVHAYQPESVNLLVEQADGAHPVKDAGIRLGWDDEQILVWYMRQMSIDSSVHLDPSKRLDAPLAVFGYTVDVRKVATPALQWDSLTLVRSKATLSVPRDKTPGAGNIDLGNFEGELPFQVYPAQIDGDQSKPYWLPMYFANWTGHNIVLPDDDAAAIYRTGDSTLKIDPASPAIGDPVHGTGVSGPAQNLAGTLYSPGSIDTQLLYGNSYEFRVRLRDLSGGGPPNLPDIVPSNQSPSNIARCQFKRFVAPQPVRVSGLPVNTDTPAALSSLKILRPLLNYPAVNFTGKYADPVTLLTNASRNMAGTEAFGIEDPDVDRVEITVEIQSLKMDNLLSVSGNDNYILLYKTTRAFPAVHAEADYILPLTVPIVYTDVNVLHVGAEIDLTGDLGLSGDIDTLTEIVLPTARTIRITLRAICEDKTHNAAYYGLINPADPSMDTRFGRTLQIALYQPSVHELDLFLASAGTAEAIYLQPDPPFVFDGNGFSLLFGKAPDPAPTLIQRLAKQLKLENTGLTLTGAKGERTQFGCSHHIRHTLSPESSSLTFSSRGDLMNHWIVAVSLDLNRDWSWDGLAPQSLILTRTLRFTHDDPVTEVESEIVGDIELRRTASFEALQVPQRDFSRILFLDAVEPKNTRLRPAPHSGDPRFPDTIEISYTIKPVFKAGHGSEPNTVVIPPPPKNPAQTPPPFLLPITTPPAQVPRIVSAGIALSPYKRNTAYSATESRRRYLWVEFEEPILDPQDAVFARVLAYAPDQLLSNNHPELLVAPEEPALPIDPEYIRTIPPGATNDLAGLNAMQPMEQASDSEVHYILPVPPGLHANAPEMFGFFTYEFRIGHFRHPGPDGSMSFSTAQGRFGRPLRATGLQHPAPALLCSANRDELKLYVLAPYSVAVLNGKDYTADPPRTELWCLLYAQVRQADNLDFVNILLDDKMLDLRVQIDQRPQRPWNERYTVPQRMLLRNLTIRNWKDDLSYAKATHLFQLTDASQINKDSTKYGTAAWLNTEVDQLLERYGLPSNSPLSVLVVETLPMVRSLQEAVSNLGDPIVASKLNVHLAGVGATATVAADPAQPKVGVLFEQAPSPVSDELGKHRLLRTSPLTEVPSIC